MHHLRCWRQTSAHHTSIAFAFGGHVSWCAVGSNTGLMLKSISYIHKKLTFARTRILFLLAPPLHPLPLPPLTLARKRTFSSTFFFFPLSLPPLVLSIHIAPLRGGGGPSWGGLGLPSSTSHHYHLGVPLSLFPHLPPPPPSPRHHYHVDPTLSAPITKFRPLGFMCVRGQFYRWLSAQWVVCAPTSFLKQSQKTLNMDCRSTPHLHCLLSGGTSVGVRLAETQD